MRILLLMLLAAGGLSAAECTTNILLNCSFSPDGLGGILDWSFRAPATTRIERSGGKGPDGSPAFRIVFGETDYLTQRRLSLCDGETYEAQAWVRTRALAGGVRFYSCDRWWSKDVRSPDFPKDTGGKWERISWRFTPVAGAKEHSLVIGGRTGAAGVLEIAALQLVPVSPGACACVRRASPSPRLTARIVPIDPLLADIDPENAKMTFYYPGDLDGDVRGFEIAARIGSGVKAAAALGADRRARLSFGKLPASCRKSFHLTVGIRKKGGAGFLRENVYPVTLRPRPPAGPAGKRLNNFVTELFRSERPSAKVRFFNPRRGWVYAGFEGGAPEATVFIDGIAAPIIRPRRGERSETMRMLEAGWHTLHLRMAPEGVPFAVRAVKRIVHVSPSFDMKKTDLMEWRPRYDFTRRYAFPFFNVASFYRRTRAPGRISIENAALEERGIAIETMAGFGSSEPGRGEIARIRGVLFHADGWPQGFPLTIDENGVSSPRPWRVNLSEALWPMCDMPREINGMYADAVHSVYTDPTTQTSEISAIVNSGRGCGMLYPEAYCTVLKDPAAAHQWEEQLLSYRASVTNFVPAAANSIVYYFGTFLEPGHYTDWSRPEGDMKRLVCDYVRRIATDPAFGEPGGIAAGYFSYTDDDMARWLCRVVRYYAVEGGTGNLAEKYGFAYLPGHLKNADFDEGLAHWKVRQGGEGGVQPLNVPGYGASGGQNRKKAPRGTGDNVALFTRKSSPNVISQRLTGLKPGELYHVHFVAADEADVKRGDHAHFIRPEEADFRPQGYVTNGTFMARATVTGGEEIPELTGLHIPYVRRKNWKEILFNQYRVVFRATAPEAELSITDWKSERDPGGEPGRRIYVNFVNVRRYYVEDDVELRWLTTRRRDNDFNSRD